MSEELTQKAPARVKFVYDKPEDLRATYANGAYGGIGPKGELICNFFFEQRDVPKEEIIPLIEGKPQVEKIVRTERISHEPDEIVIKRNISAVLIIPIQEVGTIANWMLDKLKASKIIVEKGE